MSVSYNLVVVVLLYAYNEDIILESLAEIGPINVVRFELANVRIDDVPMYELMM